MSNYDLKTAYEWVQSYTRLLNSMGEETEGARHACRALQELNEFRVNDGHEDELDMYCPGCGNPYEGNNFCMPSACQWEE